MATISATSILVVMMWAFVFTPKTDLMDFSGGGKGKVIRCMNAKEQLGDWEFEKPTNEDLARTAELNKTCYNVGITSKTVSMTVVIQ